jgi:hypothetical protein
MHSESERLLDSLDEGRVAYPQHGPNIGNQIKEMRMDKQLSTISYWLGIISFVLALIFRVLTAMNKIPPFLGAPGGTAISYLSFLHGAALFFLLTIATWCKTAKS